MCKQPENCERSGRAAARPAVALLVAIAIPLTALAEPFRNGFDLANPLVPASEILRGGPPRDGIPALDAPRAIPAEDADWAASDSVIGVALNGEARAYPLNLLEWHELVNDTLGGVPILVSYCPLCGTALTFDRRLDGRVHRFGVSGLLHKSDLLMFDRATGSLWSQIMARAVSGTLRGQRLSLVRSRLVDWKVWREQHPNSTVLSRNTGHRRDYGASPYGGYASSTELYFPVDVDPRYPLKLWTLGLRIAGGAARAYPATEVARAGGAVRDEFEGRLVEVEYSEKTGRFRFVVPNDIEVVEGYWFAWAAFHPTTSVFRADPL